MWIKQHGKLNGRGTMSWPDGCTYEGVFVNNMLCGSGVYTWKFGSTYEGEVNNGLRHGSGVQRHMVGDAGPTFEHTPKRSLSGTGETIAMEYKGEWKNGKRHGRGRLSSESDNSAYEGEWQEGRRHGHGVMVYPSGNSYNGHWVNDMKQGQGTMEWKTLNQSYTGQWSEDSPHGFGEYIWFNIVGLDAVAKYLDKPPEQRILAMPHLQCPNRYVGEFRHGQRHGQGTFYYADGSKYTGDWKEGKKV